MLFCKSRATCSHKGAVNQKMVSHSHGRVDVQRTTKNFRKEHSQVIQITKVTIKVIFKSSLTAQDSCYLHCVLLLRCHWNFGFCF